MRKLLAVLLSLAMVFALVAACGGGGDSASSGDQIKVGIVNLHPSESGYREANVADMDRVFSAANGYEALKANYNTINEQLDAAQQFINEGVDYLLISAADASGWDNVLQAALDAGVTVFLFDRWINSDPSLFTAAVVSDTENQGKNAVAWLEAQNREGGYRFIHINGQMGSAAQIGRAGPLVEAVDAKADWEIVREGTGGDTWSADEAKKIVEAAIAAGEDFNVVYAHNDGMAEGAMIALQEAGISHGVDGDVWIMGFDYNKFALRYVQSGEWNFDGQASPFQAEIIHGFIQTLEAGGTLNIPADKTVIVDETVIDTASITDDFIAQFGLGDDPGPRSGAAAAPPEAATEGIPLYLITDLGTIDDKSFNQGSWEGMVKYAEENGIPYDYIQPAGQGDDAYLNAIDLAVQGGAQVIVTPGFLFETPIYTAQSRYPDVNFILLDGIPHPGDYNSEVASNTLSIFYAEEQAGFLAGYAAVMDGYRNLGFMGGMAVPAVVRFGHGYVQGAEYAAGELGLGAGDVKMNYYYTGTFAPAPEIQTMAAAWYQDGVEVIFSCGGGIYQSIVAAAEQTGNLVIGVDVDQSAESATIITSAMKDLSVSVYDALADFYAGTFRGGQSITLAADTGGVGLPMATSKFTTFTQAQYDAIFAQLVDGSVRVNNDSNIGPTDLGATAVAVNYIE